MTLSDKAIAYFWAWFEENYLEFQSISDFRDEAWQNLVYQAQMKLVPFCPHLVPEIGRVMRSEEGYQMVISASGDKTYFPDAEKVISRAPQLPLWDFYALVPPLPPKIQIRLNFGEHVLDPEKIWFLSMTEQVTPEFFGLHLGIGGIDGLEALAANPEMKDQLMQAIYKLLVMIVGEKSFAMDIQHVQIGPLPDDVEEQEVWTNLYQLGDHLNEFRKLFPSPHILGRG